jgi:hypothetical protein
MKEEGWYWIDFLQFSSPFQGLDRWVQKPQFGFCLLNEAANFIYIGGC